MSKGPKTGERDVLENKNGVRWGMTRVQSRWTIGYKIELAGRRGKAV